MPKNPYQDWAESQLQALLEAGIDLPDAQRTISWVLSRVPGHAHPATWVPTVEFLSPYITEADVADARVDWYAKRSVGSTFARLLDAELMVQNA